MYLGFAESTQRVEHGAVIHPGGDIRGAQMHGLVEFVCRVVKAAAWRRRRTAL